MHSCLYAGDVYHQRIRPVHNEFRYSLFMVYLDLDELPHVFDNRAAWSANHFNIAWFRRRDHLGDPDTPLDTSVRDLVQDRTGTRPVGPIRMLTHLRYFGYCFNPVSFYYCYDAEDRYVQVIVAEIHNTPWVEMFCYVLDESENQGDADHKKFRVVKQFHISPFIDMDVRYEWRFSSPDENLAACLIDYHDETRFFEARLNMNRVPMTASNLNRLLLMYPPMTFKVIAGIYWQALRLWNKGAPFYVHPAKQGDAHRERQDHERYHHST